MKNVDLHKSKLSEEKAALVNELGTIGSVKDSRNPDDWQAKPANLDILESDPNEVGDRIGSYENNTALVNELEQRLRDVDDALTRIEKGAFGVCEIGGEEIEEDRLEANPAARTCKKHMNV